MTEIISGLHSCKAENAPKEGEVKNFLVENKTSAKGKQYLKIKSATVEYGGRPYKIVSAKPTGFIDPHGNVSFNIEVTQENGQQTPQIAPQRAFTGNGGDDRSSRIERQHSQEMAIRYFAMTGGQIPTTTQLREMTSWFQRDISTSPVKQENDEGHVHFTTPDSKEQEEIDF